MASAPANSSNTGATPATGYRFGPGTLSTFNFNEFSMSYPRRDSRGVFAYAERKVFGTDNVKLYVDTAYQNAATENQLAPSATGSFTTAGATELVIPARTASPLPTTDGPPTSMHRAGRAKPGSHTSPAQGIRPRRRISPHRPTSTPTWVWAARWPRAVPNVS